MRIVRSRSIHTTHTQNWNLLEETREAVDNEVTMLGNEGKKAISAFQYGLAKTYIMAVKAAAAPTAA